MGDTILLQNMMFYGYHGVYEYEREHGQKFFVDVELSCNMREAQATDDIHYAVDYVSVYNVIQDIFQQYRFKLLETLAEQIAKDILAFPVVQSVTVRVRKPLVPIAGQLDFVQIEITRGHTV